MAVNAKDITEDDLNPTNLDKGDTGAGVDKSVVEDVAENDVTISSSVETPQIIEQTFKLAMHLL